MQPRLWHVPVLLVVAVLLTAPFALADTLPVEVGEEIPPDADVLSALSDLQQLLPTAIDEQEILKKTERTIQEADGEIQRTIHDLEPPLIPDEDTPDAPQTEENPAAPASLPTHAIEPNAPSDLLVAGALAAAVGIAVAATKQGLWTRLGAALLTPLFSRFEGPAVLDHPRRAELHHLVSRTPGITVPGLCKTTGLSRNTVLHHLRMLGDRDIIVAKRMGRAIHWFENGGRYGRERKTAYAVLCDDRSRDVARFVLKNPGTTQVQVGRALGLAPSVIHWHVRRLEQASLVDRQRAGRAMQCFPTSVLPGLDL